MLIKDILFGIQNGDYKQIKLSGHTVNSVFSLHNNLDVKRDLKEAFDAWVNDNFKAYALNTRHLVVINASGEYLFTWRSSCGYDNCWCSDGYEQYVNHPLYDALKKEAWERFRDDWQNNAYAVMTPDTDINIEP